MSASLDALIPELQPFARELVRAAGVAGIQPRVTSTRRTYADQKRLYDRYLAGMSPYPAAPPGHSAHEYGWAFDMVCLDQTAAGIYWEQLGGVWGGRGGDDIHFEYPGFKEAYGADIRTAQSLDDANAPQTDVTTDFKDFLLNFVPVYGELTSGVEIAHLLGFSQPEWLKLFTHPGDAVAKYPWLRLLGPPFIFYDVPLFK